MTPNSSSSFNKQGTTPVALQVLAEQGGHTEPSHTRECLQYLHYISFAGSFNSSNGDSPHNHRWVLGNQSSIIGVFWKQHQYRKNISQFVRMYLICKTEHFWEPLYRSESKILYITSGFHPHNTPTTPVKEYSGLIIKHKQQNNFQFLKLVWMPRAK